MIFFKMSLGFSFPATRSILKTSPVTSTTSTITHQLLHMRSDEPSGNQIATNTDEYNTAVKPNRHRRIQGPPIETKPCYDEIHGPLGKHLDSFFLRIFRSKMETITNITSPLPKDDYQGLMEVANQMNRQYSKQEVRVLSRKILQSLFPSWLPSAFSWMFAAPFPEFSARMNAYATYVAGQWLMGECELMDFTTKDQGMMEEEKEEKEKNRTNPGLLVKRCRFLEESGCASVCVNACKLPTQDFFNHDMGLPLTMTPNYETFECEFKFGVSVDETEEQLLLNTPCLGRCSMAGTTYSHGNGEQNVTPSYRETINSDTDNHQILQEDTCHLMMD